MSLIVIYIRAQIMAYITSDARTAPAQPEIQQQQKHVHAFVILTN